MNKKTSIAIGAGISLVIIVGVAFALTYESEPDKMVFQGERNKKLGLVINTPETTTTLETLNEVYSKASSTGIGRSNVYMFWNIIEPEQRNYNWDQYDVLMSFNKKSDLKVTLYFSLINGNTLGPFPNWIGKPSLASISEDRLIEVLDTVLSRYDIVDTLIIAGETDAHFRYNEQNIPVYAELFNNVYDRLKEKHPDIKIGNAFSLHGVLNKNLEHIVEDLAIGDFVAFTYFPVDSLNEINKNSTAAISDLEKTFDLVPNKNVAFFEISWSTADLVGGSQTAQKEFLNLLFDFYKENESKLEFVTWYRLNDRPQDSCYIDPESVEGTINIGGESGLGSSEYVVERLSSYICNAGLLKTDGNPKLAWNEFSKLVEMSINS
ncbi:MAG: hypothetical protein V3U12_02930 [Nitrosopumilaceae archaeon]